MRRLALAAVAAALLISVVQYGTYSKTPPCNRPILFGLEEVTPGAMVNPAESNIPDASIHNDESISVDECANLVSPGHGNASVGWRSCTRINSEAPWLRGGVFAKPRDFSQFVPNWEFHPCVRRRSEGRRESQKWLLHFRVHLQCGFLADISDGEFDVDLVPCRHGSKMRLTGHYPCPLVEAHLIQLPLHDDQLTRKDQILSDRGNSYDGSKEDRYASSQNRFTGRPIAGTFMVIIGSALLAFGLYSANSPNDPI